MLRLIRYLKAYIWQLILLVGLVYIQVWTDLQLPDYMATIVNTGIVNKDNTVIWQNGWQMLLVALLGACCTITVGYLASKIATGFSKKIREDVFTKVESFSMQEFDHFSTASLITRSTNDIQQIQMVLVMILRLVLMAPIMGVGAIVKAYQKAPSMSWLIALAVAVVIAVIVTVFIIAFPKFKILQKLVDRLNLVTRENLTGLKVIRAFNNQHREENKFDKANTDLTRVNLFVNRIGVIMQPIMMLVMNVTSLAVVWVGANLIESGNLQIGDMMAFMQYAMQVIIAFLLISMVFIMIPRGSVSGQRIAEVLATKPAIIDPRKPKKFPLGSKGSVEFKNVTFTYPNADIPVLKNISFRAEPGQKTAFIGSTGSGKSTLVNLIPRFYDVTEGQVLVNDRDVRTVKQKELCAKIGYVPQKGILFSGTIKSNVAYGVNDASPLTIKKAINIAQATDFVMKSEKKLLAPISQSGSNVSGGQKQRLSIARAIAKNPQIYIFDDTFSALDFKTDAKLRAALPKATGNATVLIVAQRVSTIMQADKIIVLDDGMIVGQGTHSELLKSNSVYREIASSQLSESELSQSNSSLMRPLATKEIA